MTAPEPIGDLRRRALRAGLAAAGVGLLLLVVGFLLDPRRATASYLVAFAAGLALALGALALVMISHVLTAHWFVVLRRLTTAVAATLPLLALLFLGLLPGLGALYPWVPPVRIAEPELLEAVQKKAVWLNVPFFLVRAAVYFVVFLALAELLRRWSLRMDREPSARLVHLQRRLSAGGLPVYAFALTFAVFDWLMSLSPWWYSTIYGVYVFAAGFVGMLGLLAVLARLAQRAGVLPRRTRPPTSTPSATSSSPSCVFWAYVAFSQLLVIWIGDEPVEARWLWPRLNTPWAVLGVVILLGMFAGPFLLLLLKDFKRSPPRLAALGGWLVLMLWLDVYWLVMPEVYPAGPRPHWLDLAALAFVGGSMLAFGAWRAGGHPLVAPNDPQLEGSIEYHGH